VKIDAPSDSETDAPPVPDPLRQLENKAALVGWRAWVGLSCAGLVIAAAVVWGCLGDVPTRVSGRCILMFPEGVADVTAEAAGRVSSLQVKGGDVIIAGQEVATVAAPELAEQIDNARARVADLDAMLAAAQAQTQRSVSYSDVSLAEQMTLLERQEEATQRKLALAEQQVATSDLLRRDGLITEQAREGARLDLDDARNALRDVERRIAEAEKRRTDFLQHTTRDVTAIALQAHDARRELLALQAQSGEFTHVRSPVAGRVVEIKAAPGTLVKRDTPLFGVERSPTAASGDVEALMFVSAAEGKKIENGAEAEIVPEVARREEHGVLFGQVKQISDYPSTPQGLLARIANPTLMRELAGSAAPFQVRIRLKRAEAVDAAARNPYAWSAAAGPGVEISSGTLCQGEVLVLHERPIGFVIPIFRSALH
jgi:HlyD family secretion protein